MTPSPAVSVPKNTTTRLQACIGELFGTSNKAFEQKEPLCDGWPPMRLATLELKLDPDHVWFILSGALYFSDEDGKIHTCNPGGVTYLPTRSALGELLLSISTGSFAKGIFVEAGQAMGCQPLGGSAPLPDAARAAIATLVLAPTKSTSESVRQIEEAALAVRLIEEDVRGDSSFRFRLM